MNLTQRTKLSHLKHKVIETTIAFNVISASILCLTSMTTGAIAVVGLFAASPFIADPHEQAVKNFLSIPAKGITLSLPWLLLSGIAGYSLRHARAEEPADEVAVTSTDSPVTQTSTSTALIPVNDSLLDAVLNEIENRVAVPPTTQYHTDSCLGCAYWSGDRSGGRLFVCAFHPYGKADCPDYENWDETAIEDSEV